MKKSKNLIGLSGFSLVELMVVISVIIVVIGLTLGLTNSSAESLKMVNSANDISSLFNRAKEAALVKNKNVQVRIYEAPDDFENTGHNLIGIGFIEAPDDLATIDSSDPDSLDFSLITKRFQLEEIQFLEKAPYSTIITDAPFEGTEDDENLGPLPYKAFGFSPNNTADLEGDKEWTLTLIKKGEPSDALPQNFITLQLFPNTGRVAQIQPN